VFLPGHTLIWEQYAPAQNREAYIGKNLFNSRQITLNAPSRTSVVWQIITSFLRCLPLALLWKSFAFIKGQKGFFFKKNVKKVRNYFLNF
jgi:RNAse (barnase) inhibitor barstar